MGKISWKTGITIRGPKGEDSVNHVSIFAIQQAYIVMVFRLRFIWI